MILMQERVRHGPDGVLSLKERRLSINIQTTLRMNQLDDPSTPPEGSTKKNRVASGSSTIEAWLLFVAGSFWPVLISERKINFKS